MDLQELLARLEADGVASLSNEELAFVEAALAGTVETVDLTNPSAEDIAALETANEAIETVRTETATRAEASAERAARATELAERLRPVEATTEAPPEGEGDDEGTGDGEGTEGEGGAAGEPAPVAPTPDTGAGGAEADPPEQAEPIAAAAVPARPSLAAIARRRPASHAPEPRRTSGTVITAAADIPGISAGAHLDSDALDQAFMERMRAVSGVPSAQGVKYPVARIQTHFPEDRVLREADASYNQRVMDAVTAAGGPCAPVEVDYSVAVIGTADRPLRGALQQYQGSRGGVRFIQPPRIGDYAAGVSVWTQDTDASANAINGVTTKPCVHIDCDDEVVVKTEAIPICGTIGNWEARNYPERVAAFRELLAIEAARFTEARHLTAIDAGSTAWSSAQLLGTTRDTLTTVERAIAAVRDIFRMDDAAPIDALANRQLRRQMRVDVTRQLPGDDELATTDAEIDAWFAIRGVSPTWLLDEVNGRSFGNLAAGTVPGWPSASKIRLFPRGSWKHLDDGVLDLSVSGPYHDSVLNKSNDAQIWMETFENVYFQGTWSVVITLDTCPDGATSEAVSIDPCTTGS